MNSMSQINTIGNALMSVEALEGRVGHYEYIPDGSEPYCVWAEDSEAMPLVGDVKKIEQQLTGTIDLFTKTDGDPIVDSIQTALNRAIGSQWRLNSVQYEDETEYIHFGWVWWLV